MENKEEQFKRLIDQLKREKDKAYFICFEDLDGYIFKSIYKEKGSFYEYYNLFDIFPIEESDLLVDDIEKYELKIYSSQTYYVKKRKRILDDFNRSYESEFSKTKLLVENLDLDFKKVVSFSDTNKDPGILVAIVSTDEDYYWVVITKDKKIHLHTCVAQYQIVENQIGFDFSNEEIKDLLKKNFVDKKDSIDTLVYCPI